MSNAYEAWLSAPWAGALLRFVADPAMGLDPKATPLGLTRALAIPAARGRLGRMLLPQPSAAQSIAACRDSPAARLALVPPEDLLFLMGRAAGWLLAARLAGLLRTEEVAAARLVLGDSVFDWALRAAPLLPRPAAVLERLVSQEPLGLFPGAVLLGLAMGELPEPMLARLRLRAPAPLWAKVARHAAPNCATTAEGRASSMAALRRLLREEAPPWSVWLN